MIFVSRTEHNLSVVIARRRIDNYLLLVEVEGAVDRAFLVVADIRYPSAVGVGVNKFAVPKRGAAFSELTEL